MFTLNSEPSDLPNRRLASATTLRDLLIAALANPLLTDGDLADIANAADSQAWMRSELNPMRESIEKTVASLDAQSRIIPIKLDPMDFAAPSYLTVANQHLLEMERAIMASFAIPADIYGEPPAPAEDDAAAPLIVTATPLS